MTSAITEVDGPLARIHETGYWRVVIHPTVFEEHRIGTLSTCEKLVETAHVRLRGWDYPHVDRTGYIRGNDWIQSSSDFANHVEVWRFFQSAQFAHQFAVATDRTPPGLFGPDRFGGALSAAPPWLDFVDVIYTLTEILEFARGLAYRGVLEPAVNIQVELHGMEDRMIIAPPGRLLEGRYFCAVDTLSWCVTTPAAVLVAAAPRLAIDAAVHIVERFNWPDPPRGVFEEDQRRFLEHRV